MATLDDSVVLTRRDIAASGIGTDPKTIAAWESLQRASYETNPAAAAAAQETADQAQTTADTAQTTATNAQATADEALEEVATKQPLDALLTSISGINWTAGTQALVLTGADTAGLVNVGAASATDILDRQSGDARYAPSGTVGLTDGDKGDIVVASSGTSWTFDSTVVSAFARTFLDDTSASAVRGTIGAEPTITAGTTAQYWRGDKSWQVLNSAAVGLGNVENKSSATIRGEITSANVTSALGYTPLAKAQMFARNQTSGGTKRYYLCDGCTFSVATTTTLAELYVQAFSTNLSATFISMEVTTAGTAGSKIRLGIYACGNDGRPSTLIVDAGEIDASTTGVKDLAITQTIREPVWLAWFSNGTTAQLRACTFDTLVGQQLYGGADLSSTPTVMAAYRIAQTYGALPSTFPAGALSSVSTARAIALATG